MSYIGNVPLPQSTEARTSHTVTSGESPKTSFTVSYVPGYLDLFINGVLQDPATDYTATNGTSVTLTSGAVTGDTVSFIARTQTSALMALPLKDSSGAEILSESGSTVTLANVDTATIGSSALVVDSSGKVGIGTSSPSQKFVCSNAGADNILMCENTTYSISTFMQSSNGGGVLGTLTNHNLNFLTNNTERMRIDSSGHIWAPTNPGTDPWAATSGTFLKLSDSSYPISATAQSNIVAIFNRNTSTGVIVEFKYNNANVGGIITNGTTTSYATSSDYRLKENITNITDGISRVKLLNPSRFNFIADPDNTVDGFIAHEVSDIVPEAITGEKDAVDDDGNPEYQGIDQSKLVPLLTAALQESIALIESQQSQIDALTARIIALETA